MLRTMLPNRERLPRPLVRFEEEMERLMERFFTPEEGWWTGKIEFMPHTNVAETETAFEITVELPGMKPEEVTVELKDGRLWVAGEKKEEKEEKGKAFHTMERRYGEFRRVFNLPVAVEEEKVEAKFAEGVLRVIVPKATKALPKAIKVNAT